MTVAAAKPSEPRRMLTLLQSQREGYQQLVELGRQQTQLIESGRAEQLLSLLSQRQALIEQLADLGREVAAYQSHWPDIAAELGPDEAERARGLVREVEGLLSQIIAQDERDRTSLAADHQRTGAQLRQTAAAPRAIGAYKTASGQSPRFTDRRG